MILPYDRVAARKSNVALVELVVKEGDALHASANDYACGAAGRKEIQTTSVNDACYPEQKGKAFWGVAGLRGLLQFESPMLAY